jgi:histidinol-phosphatase (PHP family)
MLIPQDYHMHTTASCDSRATMAEMCQGAVDHGVAEIGFSEHYDLHPGEVECRDYFKLEAWAAELERCRRAFGSRLTIRAGIEIGEPHLFATEARAMLARYPFDYCLGSLHWVGAESIFHTRTFERQPAEVFFPTFFAELERMTALGGFDILSHFDVPVRTAMAVYGRYDPRDYEGAIRPVLQNVIAHGIALDLNTAALRRRARVLTPGLDILRWYVEMGGERVSLGSDAHEPGHVGANLPDAIEIARAAGLKYLTFFEGRQATLKPLP